MATALQYGNEITIEVPRDYASARMMARYFFAAFWLIIFTGALRKWVMPHFTALYILQDIPIGLAYLYAIWKGLFDRGYMFLSIVLLSTVLTLQGLLQIVISGLNPFVAAIGLHNYLFYLPMLLVFPLCLTEKYRRDFVRWNLLFSIPMCALAVAQAESPLTAWVNHTSEGDAFGVPGAENVARVSGTFNFTYFYGIWVALAVSLCLGEWLLPKGRRVIQKQWLLILCTFAVNLCHLVSASRLAILFASAALVGGLVGAVILGSYRAILAIGGIIVLLPIAAVATYMISPAEFNIVVERFTGSNYTQNSKERVMFGFYGFLTEPRFDLVGAGIGMGVDAAHVGSADAYNFTYDLAEQDSVRNVMELGTLVGLFYMVTRLGFLTGMIFLAVRIARSGSAPHVVPLSFFLFVEGYLGDMTRAATMTTSQLMMGYAFILGAYFYPDRAATPVAAIDSQSMRFA